MKNRKVSAIVVLLSGVMGMAQAVAGQSTNLTIKGHVVPSSCDISEEGGGGGVNMFDLGNINTTKLNADKPTKLEAKNYKFAVSCEQSVRFSLKVSGAQGEKAGEFSLGKGANNADIGKYIVKLKGKESSVDGKEVGSMLMQASETAFNPQSGSGDLTVFNAANRKFSGVDIDSAVGERKAKNKVYAFEITPEIAASKTLDVNSNGGIDIEASAVFEVVYI